MNQMCDRCAIVPNRMCDRYVILPNRICDRCVILPNRMCDRCTIDLTGCGIGICRACVCWILQPALCHLPTVTKSFNMARCPLYKKRASCHLPLQIPVPLTANLLGTYIHFLFCISKGLCLYALLLCRLFYFFLCLVSFFQLFLQKCLGSF